MESIPNYRFQSYLIQDHKMVYSLLNNKNEPALWATNK